MRVSPTMVEVRIFSFKKVDMKISERRGDKKIRFAIFDVFFAYLKA